MSYELDVSRDARDVWRGLDVELQEAVLNDVERIAANPHILPRGSVVRDVVVIVRGVRHYVFIRLGVSHQHRRVSVHQIGHFRGTSPPGQ